MVLPLLALPLHLVAATAQRPNPQYTLDAQGDTFVVRDGARKETVSRVASPTKEKIDASFRRDRRWAVWDERGLTTRDRDWSATDRLEAIPVSPRLQSREQIAATIAKVKKGERSRAASGLSGARRIGTRVYLLPRWDGTDGRPWLEALVEVDLGKTHPKARLLGSFGGLSLGRGRVDDRLGIEEGRLNVAVNAEGAWGFRRLRFAAWPLRLPPARCAASRPGGRPAHRGDRLRHDPRGTDGGRPHDPLARDARPRRVRPRSRPPSSSVAATACGTP